MAERDEGLEAGAEDGPPQEGGAAAISLALGRAGRGKGRSALDAKAEAFLDQQTELIRLQKEHLHEQRLLQLAHLRVRRWKDRFSLALQALGLAAGVAAAAVIGAMAWTAHQDHGLVIEAFSTSPAFAQRGLTGEAMAGELMDRIQVIKRQIDQNSISQSASVKTDRDTDIKVEIPETGLSITAAWRLLRDWMGGGRKVEGELRQADDGSLVLTARVDGRPAVTAKGAPGDLDKLEQQAAEQIYQASDPVNFVIYLDATGRKLEALAEAERLATRSPETLSLWATVEHDVDPERAWALADMAARYDHTTPYPYFELLRAERRLGHAEAALTAARRLQQRMQGEKVGPTALLSGAGGSEVLHLAQTTIAVSLGDYAHDPLRLAKPGADASEPLQPLLDAAMLHDVDRARALMAEAVTIKADGALGLDRARYEVDAAAGDGSAATADAARIIAADEDARARDPVPAGMAGLARVEGAIDAPRLAQARLMTGDVAGAAASIAASPLDAYDAVRARGRIASAGRDWAGADRRFALALRLGPSLPFAELDWAASLLARGDVDGAIARLAAAHAKAPQFADPLELWGEALMKKGDHAGAADKFRQAATLAPAWTRNRLMLGQAVRLSGQQHEASRQ
jgi:tetratricopeptide (TPR) repeat protein